MTSSRSLNADAASPRPLVLVGLRCSGKSTLGRRLAERLGQPFLDLDEELARRHAAAVGEPPRPAGELLARLGPAAFRELERATLAELLARPGPFVLATGGGAVESPASRALLRERARCLWLRAEPELLRRRMAADPTPRPALTAAGALEEIEALARRRAPLYAEVAERALEVREEDDVDALARRVLALFE